MYHKANLNRMMADYTGQPLAKIEEDTDRDRWGSAVVCISLWGVGRPAAERAS
jgi:ATP-dependent protease ClpP protease subunit